MFRTLALLLVVAAAHADDSCTGWDDMVEDMLFTPAREAIVKATAEFPAIPNYDEHFRWGTHVKFTNATVGNLSTFDIVHLPGRSSASYMCQVNENITIALDLGLKDLEFRAENFMAKIPLLPEIGNTKATFKNTGNKFSISVTIMTDDQSKCVVTLNYLQIQDYGSTTFHFEDGRINHIYQWIMSHGYHPLTRILKRLNLLKSMEASLRKVAANVISKEGQQICDIINGGGL